MKNQKKHSDEEIQRIIDDQKASREKEELMLLNEDAKLYNNLFNDLKEEPAFSLPDDFAKQTLEVAYKRKSIKDLLWKISLYAVVSIPLITLSLIAIISIGPEMFWSMLGVIKGNISYLLLGIVLVSLIQFLDHKLVKGRFKEIEH